MWGGGYARAELHVDEVVEVHFLTAIYYLWALSCACVCALHARY